ncbi:hypothetical protein B0T21DRAFT_296698 [Apiosordaria backusii]|uniref:Peptidase metallopeptidase domain-containing protein n=1 Tax=Apiosordaria backusii TaxID=314023 RepID=A0AA40DWU8_9PEZI|nr:hypothetical protein B0T21DRAFT_296698 [Apiosordaria backusii]
MAVIRLNKRWPQHKELRIQFLDGTWAMRNRVVMYARQWEEHVNLVFNFVSHGPSDIRISFDPKYMTLGHGESWSSVGTNARRKSLSQPTMLIRCSIMEDRDGGANTILHEFGHCLAFEHEHQSPEADIQWNRAVVLAESGMSAENTDQYILTKFEKDGQVDCSSFDPTSVLMYTIPSRWTLDGFSADRVSVLSPLDKAFAAKHYPPLGCAPSASEHLSISNNELLGGWTCLECRKGGWNQYCHVRCRYYGVK